MRLRSWSALAAVAIVSSSAHGGIAEELIAAINKCAAMTDETARYKCYDQLPSVQKAIVSRSAAAAPAAAPSPSPAPVALAAPSATPPTTPPPASATPLKKTDDDEERSLFQSEPVAADHIAATIKSYTYDFGLFVVTLDNGQVWRQVAAVGDIVHFHKSHTDQVKIWRNSFGVYVMKIEGSYTHYRVRRIE